MTTSLMSFKTTPSIRASSAGKPNPDLRKPSSVSTWWAPIFGWSNDPTYLADSTVGGLPEDLVEADPGARSRFALGCFTEEKAKQLRRKTAASETFHDIMYHSSIASRLASDVSDRYKDVESK